MKSAIERANALYKALEEFIQDGEGLHMPRDVVLEEVNNYLDDIEKRYDVFMLDLSTLGRDLAFMIDEEYFQDHQELFPRPEKCPYDARARLLDNPNFKDAVGLIHKAIIETAKRY